MPDTDTILGTMPNEAAEDWLLDQPWIRYRRDEDMEGLKP